MDIKSLGNAMPMESVKRGHLVVGRFYEEQENYFAIRGTKNGQGGTTVDFFVVLTARLNKKNLPFLRDVDSGPSTVLDLQNDWRIEVDISSTSPEFIGGEDAVLFISGGKNYLKLDGRQFLDLQNNEILDGLKTQGAIAFWRDFNISLPNEDDPAHRHIVFQWRSMGAMLE